MLNSELIDRVIHLLKLMNLKGVSRSRGNRLAKIQVTIGDETKYCFVRHSLVRFTCAADMPGDLMLGYKRQLDGTPREQVYAYIIIDRDLKYVAICPAHKEIFTETIQVYDVGPSQIICSRPIRALYFPLPQLNEASLQCSTENSSKKETTTTPNSKTTSISSTNKSTSSGDNENKSIN